MPLEPAATPPSSGPARLCLVLLVAGLAGLAPGRAAAGKYAESHQPYWRVGAHDRSLSTACQRGEFNQLLPLRLSIGYTGANGQGVTGIAKLGWNLRDPMGLGQPGFTYHFRNDGYSNCRVYIAGRRLTR